MVLGVVVSSVVCLERFFSFYGENRLRLQLSLSKISRGSASQTLLKLLKQGATSVDSTNSERTKMNELSFLNLNMLLFYCSLSPSSRCEIVRITSLIDDSIDTALYSFFAMGIENVALSSFLISVESFKKTEIKRQP